MLILGSSSDLARARRLASWVHGVAIDDVVVTLPWLDAHEQQRAARSLKSYFNYCGCHESAIAFIFVLAACLWIDPWTGAPRWMAGSYSLMSALLAAVPAKLAALLWSRWRLRVLLARLARMETR